MPMGITKKNLASRLKAIREKKPKRKRSVGKKKPVAKKAKTVSAGSTASVPLSGAHAVMIHQKHDASKYTTPLKQPYDTPKFNTMNGMGRITINFDAVETAVLIHFWNQSAYRTILSFKNSSGALRHQLMDKLNCYNVEEPISARCLRATMKIRNVTRADQVAGMVRVLSCTEFPDVAVNVGTAALPMQIDSASFDAIVNYVRGQSRTTTISAAELRNTMSFPLAIGHDLTHRTYYPWQKPTTGQGMLNLLAATVGNEPMSPTVFVFEANAAIQTYDVSFHHQDACQYAATSALNLLAYAPTTSTQAQHDHEKKVLRDIASKGELEKLVNAFRDKQIAKRLTG
jgi:hypothetical protein